MGECKICGKPVTGKKQYCDECKKARKREYFNNKYNNDDSFRQNHIDRVKVRKSTKLTIGTFPEYSSHARSNFEDEQRIVANQKKRTLNGRKTSYKEDSFGVKANKNYDAAKNYEEKVLDSTKVCEICGGDDFEICDGMIICNTCGLCEDVFAVSVFGKPELVEDDLTRAMRAHFKGADNDE